jgi:hypothetical protein
LALSFAAGAAGAAAPGLGDFEFTLAPGQVEEICLRLEPRDGVQWRFSAESPVDFNLHWHEGRAVHLPVRHDAVREHAGSFVAPHGDDYCLMWTALAAPVRISGRVERGR